MSGPRLFALLVPSLAAVIILDASLVTAFGPRRPFDPYLVLTVWLAARSARRAPALFGGALVGLVQDGLGSAVFGVHYLAKVIVAHVVASVSPRLLPGEPLTWAVLLGGATVLQLGAFTGLGLMLGQSFEGRTPGQLVSILVLNVVVGTAACLGADRLGRRLERRGGHAARARR